VKPRVRSTGSPSSIAIPEGSPGGD
jgi:hypothetical protein